MEKAKADVARLKASLGGTGALGLSWEARTILRLYAQGYHDWCSPEYRKNWRVFYREAIQQFGADFAGKEEPSTKTLYWMSFMIQFRGGRDSEEALRSLEKFWLLARRIAPKNTEKLVMDDENDEEGKKFLASLDASLKKIYHDEEGGVA